MTARKSGIVIPNRLAWHQRWLVALVSWLARLLMASWRIRLDRPLVNADVDGPMIFCLWHNRLGVCIAIWIYVVRHIWPAKGMSALISASKDGAILAEIVGNFGIKTARGSSSRRGGQALLESSTFLEKGSNIAITPDGPRGPRYHIHLGIVQLAAVTGRPIVPVGCRIHSHYTFKKAWDHFQLPLPFSRVDLHFGAPIHVPREATNHELDAIRRKLEHAMMAINKD